MNKIEKIIYDRVKTIPWIKFIIRNIYQTFLDTLPRQKDFSFAPIDCKAGYFYGFHDKSPFSGDCKNILSNRLMSSSLKTKKGERLEVGYFKFSKGKLGEFIKVSESGSWNYHKGCRLQWIDRNKLIFNSVKDGHLVSKIIEIGTLNEQTIKYPIDTVSCDGQWATSFSYGRLQKLMPGYGYDHDDGNFLSEKAPKQTGLFLVNLFSNSRELLVSLNELAMSLSQKSLIWDYWHYVTHSEFSMDGRYISFLHRWTGKDTRKRTSRLIVYDLKTLKWCAAPTNGMVSHYVWNLKNQIIAYCNINGEDGHVLFNVPDLNQNEIIEPLILNSDGHQSFINSHSFVTDTYPNRYRMAKLFYVDMDSSKVELIASLYSPKKFQTSDFQNHIACDLHPRVSPDGRYVCFDSVHTGLRSLCVMLLP